MIYAIVGKPGSGKSLLAVRIAEQQLNKGRNVYSNILLFPNKMKLKKKHGQLFYWEKIEQFAHIHDGIIIWDEVGAYFDSRGYMDFPTDVRIKLQQHRKDGVELYYTVQAYSRADKILRELTNVVYDCNSIFGLFSVYRWLPEEYEKPVKELRKHNGFFLYKGSKRLYSVYNTMQRIVKAQEQEKFPTMQEALQRKGVI